MNDHEDVQRLLRLKRYETPGETYFENFLEDFKERQRSELLQRSSRSILFERIGVWFSETPGTQWALPAAAAVAIGTGVFLAGNFTAENEVPASTIAEASELPSFPESNEGTIKLQLPRVDGNKPDAVQPSFGKVIPASVRASLREL